MKVYLAGPMRGYAEHNFPAFRDAARTLRRYGVQVVSPAEKDLDEGFDPALSCEAQGFDLKAALAWDLAQVLDVDAVVVLPGWEESLGATAEVGTAQAAGIDVYDYEDLVTAYAGTMIGAAIDFSAAVGQFVRVLRENVAPALDRIVARFAILNGPAAPPPSAPGETMCGADHENVLVCGACRAVV